MAALETRLTTDAMSVRKAGEERRRRLQDRLLRRAVLLRDTLITSGIAAVAQEGEGSGGWGEGTAPQEDCWAGIEEEVAKSGGRERSSSGGGDGDGDGGRRSGSGKHASEEVILKARARCDRATSIVEKARLGIVLLKPLLISTIQPRTRQAVGSGARL